LKDLGTPLPKTQTREIQAAAFSLEERSLFETHYSGGSQTRDWTQNGLK